MKKLGLNLFRISLLLVILTFGQDAAAQGSHLDYDPLYDLNGDCVIDNADIMLVANAWFLQPVTNPAHDINDDGRVNIIDIQLVAAHWGATCAPHTEGFTVDHNDVTLFDDIPDSYIEAASDMTMLFRHASVGNYMSQGLNCLWNYFPEQPDPNSRPVGCDSGIAPSEIVFDPKYNRSNWLFEYHQPPPRQNPGWWNKETLFIDRVDNLGPDEQYEVVGFKFGDVDQDPNHDISVQFFDTDPNNGKPNTSDLEELEARHPDKVLMWWSMPLNEHEQPIAKRFNEKIRRYAVDNGKILMDIADIESHHADGTLCLDAETGTTPATCPEYTFDGNHPNALGQQRLAKAVWIMMARIAGWDGNPQ